MLRWAGTVILWTIVLQAGAVQTYAGHKRLIVLAADYWCPYNCDPGTDRPGYGIEVARQIFAAAGFYVEYQQLNWSRAILMARKNQITGLIGVTREEVPELIIPDEPIGISKNAFWVRSDNDWRYQGSGSLNGMTIGVVQDYDYGRTLNPLLRSKNNDLNVQWLSGETALMQNIRKLAASRVDVVIEDEAVFRYTARSMGIAERFRLAGVEEVPDEDAYVYIGFAPGAAGSVDLAGAFSRGIRELRRSGRLALILSRYGVRDWKAASP